MNRGWNAQRQAAPSSESKAAQLPHPTNRLNAGGDHGLSCSSEETMPICGETFALPGSPDIFGSSSVHLRSSMDVYEWLSIDAQAKGKNHKAHGQLAMPVKISFNHPGLARVPLGR